MYIYIYVSGYEILRMEIFTIELEGKDRGVRDMMYYHSRIKIWDLVGCSKCSTSINILGIILPLLI